MLLNLNHRGGIRTVSVKMIMKIVFLISSLSGGGAERVLSTLANSLSKEENEIYVISLEKRKQFYKLDNGVNLYKQNNTDKNKVLETYKDFIFIYKSLKNINPDVTISFLSRCNFFVLFANLFNKERIIVCDRNNPLKEHSKIVFRISNLLYRRANLIVVQTSQIKSFYDKILQKKIRVIENPINPKVLYSQIQEKKINKENTIISIGRLEPQKDFKTLIMAFSELKDEFPNWKLKIFGVGHMKQQLETLIESLDMKDVVILCGHTYEPFYELCKAKIFVLSSFYEGFPNVLCEAMEAGLLCISSDCVSGPRELINHGENGWLFKIGNVDELMFLLKNCMKESEKIDISNAAKKTTRRLYLDKNIEEWKSVIRDTLYNKNNINE